MLPPFFHFRQNGSGFPVSYKKNKRSENPCHNGFEVLYCNRTYIRNRRAPWKSDSKSQDYSKNCGYWLMQPNMMWPAPPVVWTGAENGDTREIPWLPVSVTALHRTAGVFHF